MGNKPIQYLLSAIIISINIHGGSVVDYTCGSWSAAAGSIPVSTPCLLCTASNFTVTDEVAGGILGIPVLICHCDVVPNAEKTLLR